uniref:Uncharacterized protein n=1 Tax=Salmonella phage PMBT31 TaxID=3153514 RepID=A0AAU8GMG5_9CAUD
MRFHIVHKNSLRISELLTLQDTRCVARITKVQACFTVIFFSDRLHSIYIMVVL